MIILYFNFNLAFSNEYIVMYIMELYQCFKDLLLN